MLTTIERIEKIGMFADASDLLLYIMAASQAIENYCKRSFKRQTYTEVLDGAGSPYLVLSNYPVYSGKAYLDGKEIDLSPNDDGMLFLPDGWPKGIRNITVTYDAGYVLPGDPNRTLPEAVEVACIFAVQGLIQNPTGIKSERVGDISVTFGDGDNMLSPTVKALLTPYVGRWV
ncbi:phage gp6-like head-tail connector protein [Paenibacillus alvei]|uniref:phage gp6-like head-tail connector protein n=1 Tax=Paenibacillus alvei TaxID=44250 RepID=UPI002280EC58|nr:phage gp6-like head-tail connector protein [Paenibacillus alvei]MCY7484428.1 phage gp6-like head-tail connector protein [Paenibacillus alvei]